MRSIGSNQYFSLFSSVDYFLVYDRKCESSSTTLTCLLSPDSTLFSTPLFLILGNSPTSYIPTHRPSIRYSRKLSVCVISVCIISSSIISRCLPCQENQGHVKEIYSLIEMSGKCQANLVHFCNVREAIGNLALFTDIPEWRNILTSFFTTVPLSLLCEIYMVKRPKEYQINDERNVCLISQMHVFLRYRGRELIKLFPRSTHVFKNLFSS